MEKLTREQAAIIGLYTGILCGQFSDVHELAEKIHGGPIRALNIANNEFVEELQQKVKPQFLEICANVTTY